MLQTIVSIISYLTFIFHAFLGVFVLGQNKKELPHQRYFVLAMGLAAWSYVVALGLAAWSYVVALGQAQSASDAILTGPAVLLLAPVVLLLPMGIRADTMAKKRPRAAEPLKTNENDIDFDILNYRPRIRFVKNIGLIYLSAGIFSLLLCFFYPRTLFADMLISTPYVLMGLIMYGLSMTSLSIQAEDLVITLIMAGTIPLTLFLFYQTMGNILWTVPMLILIMTIIFKRRSMYFVVTAVTVITGVVIWLIEPGQFVLVGKLDYLARLVIYAIAIILAFFFNHTYLERLNEHEQQSGFEETIARITTNFVSLTEQNFDEKVAELLMESGRQLNADRAFIAIFSKDHLKYNYTHEWRREQLCSSQAKLQDSGFYWTLAGSWSSRQLIENAIIYVPSADSLPPEAEMEKIFFRKQNIKSLISVPIQSRERLLGFIGFDQIAVAKPWKMGELEHLRMLANILADAMVKLKSEQQITQLAYTDTLTQLPNRAQFYNRLENTIQQANEQGEKLGIIFIDLDGFKEVNDTLGHNWGDSLLKKIAKTLTACIGEDDLLARFGGDEFLMLIPKVTETSQLKAVAERIMDIFKNSISLGGQSFYVSASCGIALFPEDGENVHTLIKNADLAMYAAKRNGKSQYVFVTERMKNQIQEKMQLTNSLHQALQKNQLKVVYQPQVVAETGMVIGFEALLRWEHPRHGVISPAVFIPIAEETGLINTIGQWVLMTACAQNKAWQDIGNPPVPMAVNLSIEQFRSGNLENEIRETLAKTGLEAQYLELEITESIAMTDSLHVVATLHRLKELGITISIDDFGTEFSSLIRLKELPVDRLKIDMAFIRGINVNPKDESIIAVMIQLAKRLGLKITAEGVETQIQAGFLRDENCDDIQGYYYYKPLTAAEIEAGIYQKLPAPTAVADE